jgi:hypothetical protein
LRLPTNEINFQQWHDIFDDQGKLKTTLECISGLKNKQKISYAFEYLVGLFFASALNLKYEDANSTSGTQYCVKWSGSFSTMDPVLNGEADIISKCYGFDFIAECTMSTGAHQASQEFASTIRHYKDLVDSSKIKPESYILLIAPNFHRDTFTHFKSSEYNGRISLLSCENLGLISSYLDKYPFISHLQVKWLLSDIGKALHDATSLSEFTNTVKDLISKWDRDTYTNNYEKIIGLKSFKVLEGLASNGRKRVGASEVLRKLEQDPSVSPLLNLGNQQPLDNIERICRTLGLIHSIPVPHSDEPMFDVLEREDVLVNNLKFLQKLGLYG